MQYRNRSSRYDKRSPSRSGRRNFGRRDGRGFRRRPYRRPEVRREGPNDEKGEILKKAGRMAAKYLIYKGLLPPSSMRPKWENDDRFDEVWGRERRNFRDGEGFEERWRRRRGRGSWGGYGSDWGRERRRWRRRDWGVGDEREDLDFSPTIQEIRRRRWRERRMKCEGTEGAEGEKQDGESSLQGRRDVLGEDGLGLDKVVDNGDDSSSSYESGEVRDGDDDDLMERGFYEVDSKNGDGLLEVYGDAEEPKRLCSAAVQRSGHVHEDGGSSSTVDLSQAMSEGCLGSDGEAKMVLGGDLEVKSLDGRSEGSLEMDVSDDSKGKGLCEKSEGSMDMDISEDSEGNGLCEGLDVAESCSISKDGHDLLKISNLTSVTTKPRTSVHRKSSKIDQIFPNEPTKVVEIVSEIPKLMAEDDIRTNTSKGKEPPVSSTMPIQYMEEPVEQKHELVQNPGLFRPSGEKDNANGVIWLLRQPLKPEVEKLPLDEEMVKGHVADQEKAVHNDSSPKFEPQLNIKTEAEEQLQAPIYKVCDLNLLPPEMIESEDDDPVLDQFYTPMPVSEATRDLYVGLGCMMCNMANKTTIHCRISDDKMIPVIDLEDDSSIVYDAFGSLIPKKEPMYLSMASVTENKDLHVAYNSCSLKTSEHRTDVLCLLPSSDLDNPHT